MSILEKLHVPDGWCSSGLRANEYTSILLANEDTLPKASWDLATMWTLKSSLTLYDSVI